MNQGSEEQIRRSVPRDVPPNAVRPVKALFHHMVKHRLTYGEVSDKAGVRCETIARWKSRRSPDYFLLETVLNALGMTMIAVSFNLAELEDDALQ